MPTPTRTTRPAIVDAAAALLEDGGIDAVTMAAVADRVGVRPPSLYRHVRDRDALLRAVSDAAVDELTERLRDTDGTIAALAHTYRRFARDRPHAFAQLVGSSASVERLATAAAPVLAAVEASVGPAEALAAARWVTAWMTGFILMEQAGAFRLGGDVEEAFAWGLERIERSLQSDPGV